MHRVGSFGLKVVYAIVSGSLRVWQTADHGIDVSIVAFRRILWLAIPISAAALLLLLLAAGSALASGCGQAKPHGGGILLAPPNGELPVGATATFQATVVEAGVVPRAGREVTFKVICGPNTGQEAPREKTVAHPETGSGVPTAYFTYTDRKGAGTDLISATTTSASGKTETATISIAWSPPIDCGEPLQKLGFVLALQCRLAAAKPLVDTVLDVGQCAIGVAAFLAPEAKLADLLQDVDKVASAEELATDVGASTPLAKFAFDLAQLQKTGIVSFSQLKDTLEDAHSLPEFLRNIANLLGAIPSADVSQIALDVANLTGLGRCVDLLSKILAPAPVPAPGPAPGSSIATAESVVLGQEESGDTGTTLYDVYGGGSCGSENGEYWKVALTAGDQVTTDWGSSSDYVTGLDIWPPGTTDQNIESMGSDGRVAWSSIGDNGQQQSTFTADVSGEYVVVFDDSCGDPGPYQFTITAQAAPAGSSIATALPVVLGQEESGDTGTTPYDQWDGGGSCGSESGEYWKVALTAGDQVTIDWGSSSDYVTGLDIWPPDTTDQNIESMASDERVAWFSIGDDGQQQSTFAVDASGDYVVVFDDSCGDPGPYQFSITAQPAPAG